MNYKTPGVVIKRMNFGEADRILTILTERFGKVKAIAKGVRKIKSKLSGSLEPFMVLNLELYEGKTFFIVTGAVIAEEFPKIHSDLKKTSQMFYLGELVDKFLPENQKNEDLFFLFANALKYIESQKDDFWLRVFELKIVEATGFHPELFECIHCHEKLVPKENFWDSVEGGTICSICQKKFQHGQKVSDGLIKLFRFIQNHTFFEIEKIKKTEKMTKEAEEILKQYLESVLEREIKSKKFLKICE